MDLLAWAGWKEIGSAFIGGFLAFFLQRFLEDWNRPRLHVEVENDEGYRVLRDVYDKDEFPRRRSFVGLWLRVRVVNRGKTVAPSCRVFLTSYESARARRFTTSPSDPIELNWSHLPRGSAIDIPPNMGFFADFLLFRNDGIGSVEAVLQSPTDPPSMTMLLKARHEIALEFTPAHAHGLGHRKRARYRPGKTVDDVEWRSWP